MHFGIPGLYAKSIRAGIVSKRIPCKIQFPLLCYIEATA